MLHAAASTSMKSAATKTTSITPRFTIIGPPGSGKGFYGRPVASYLNVPLWTASTILREAAPGLDLASGHLIDCDTVSNTLHRFFESEQRLSSFILDGYPRTLKQIELMERKWSQQYQVQLCLHLDVPDFVCEQKMLGRRHCTKCHSYYNLANVQTMGFDLPPQLPHMSTHSPCVGDGCDPATDWTQRDDDTPEIVRERLRLYREHEKPIIDFYESRGRLLRFTPFLGVLDIPRMQRTVKEWLQSLD